MPPDPTPDLTPAVRKRLKDALDRPDLYVWGVVTQRDLASLLAGMDERDRLRDKLQDAEASLAAVEIGLIGEFGGPEKWAGHDVVSGFGEFLTHHREIEAARDKLRAFKTWVHSYLDTHGVPHHPPGTHGAAGCRIGDRMDWLMEQLYTVERESDRLQKELADAKMHARGADGTILDCHTLLTTAGVPEEAAANEKTSCGLIDRVGWLREENMRLRATLQRLSDSTYAIDVRSIARAALEDRSNG